MAQINNPNLGKYNFTTESYLLDFRGKLTMPMVGNYLLHTASSHAAERGFGFNDMNDRNVAWVLSRLAIELNYHPQIGETITIYTWIKEVTRFFTSRCFELVDSHGKTFGYARSIWAAIDIDSRRAALLNVAELKEYAIERDCPIEKPGHMSSPGEFTTHDRYKVSYSDLDINGHHNSMKYIEHIVDMFDIERFRDKDIRRMEISYLAEGRYGMELDIHSLESESGIYHMSISNSEKDICRAVVTWR